MTSTVKNPGADRQAVAALEAFWYGLRLVVVDTETVTDGDNLRLVSLATVTCRAGLVRGKWHTFVNPGIAVDEISSAIHHLTDDHLAGEPAFAEVAPLLISTLTAAPDEQLVFVAHSVAFDAGVLRQECERVGLTLPDLPVLDTRGWLPKAVGVRPASGRLSDLALALGIPQSRPHDALDDALACADAAVALLSRAPAAGYPNIDALLAAAGETHTTLSIPAVQVSHLRSGRPETLLPAEHTSGHSELLSARAGARMLAAWADAVHECATFRCPYLVDRVANAGPNPTRLLQPLHTALARCVAENDTAGAATLLEALLPTLDSRPADKGRLGFRTSALAWDQHWRPLLDTLGRCDRESDDVCPACQRLEPCPLDMWTDRIAELALGNPKQYAARFFQTKGKGSGTGVHVQWRKNGSEKVADAAVWICVSYAHSNGFGDRAAQVARLAVRDGCVHPDVVDYHAGRVATAGSKAALQTAQRVANRALKQRGDSTHPAWDRLESRRNQLAGRLRRLTLQPSGRVDADGNPIPVRRHHPVEPRRVRQPRFAR